MSTHYVGCRPNYGNSQAYLLPQDYCYYKKSQLKTYRVKLSGKTFENRMFTKFDKDLSLVWERYSCFNLKCWRSSPLVVETRTLNRFFRYNHTHLYKSRKMAKVVTLYQWLNTFVLQFKIPSPPYNSFINDNNVSE